MNSTEYRPSSIATETYPETEKEQEEALKQSAQLKAYREYRVAHRDDQWNPGYHFYSPDGIINDPNGLCFWKGRYHLFYQSFPPKENPTYASHRVHWGHAVSTDLIHWKDLPLAIYPDIEFACYSGATLVEDDKVTAIYHGKCKGTMLAYAKDPYLLNWKKEEANPIIPILPDADTNGGYPYGVFDSFLWKDETGYYALSGWFYGNQAAHGKDHRSVMVEHLFHSNDLKHWSYMGELAPEGFPHIPMGNDGACPYFWPFGNRYMLLNFSHLDGAYITIGDFDKTTHRFKADRSVRLNHGPRAASSFQAPCAYPDGKGGLFLLLNTKDSNKKIPRYGAMSMVYHLTPEEGKMFAIEPVETIRSLHKNEWGIKDLSLRPFEEKVLPVSGKQLDIHMKLDLKKARTLRIRLLRSPGEEEHTDVNVYMPVGSMIPHNAVTIDTLYASRCEDVLGRVPETDYFDADEDGTIDLRILVDRCVIEVFANHQTVIMANAYPTREDSQGISLQAFGNDALIKEMTVWEMNSIYED